MNILQVDYLPFLKLSNKIIIVYYFYKYTKTKSVQYDKVFHKQNLEIVVEIPSLYPYILQYVKSKNLYFLFNFFENNYF